MTKSSLKKFIIIILVLLAALVIVQSIFIAKKRFIQKANHEEVMELLTKNPNSFSHPLKDYVENINSMISNNTYYDSDLGLLYAYAGGIYDELGEEMTYYRYLGYALYYLESSNEKDYTVNIYLKLASDYICNHDYLSAKEALDKAREIEPFEDISDISIKINAYQIAAMLETNRQNYDSAEAYLEKSQECIDTSDLNSDFYEKINQISLAYVYINQNMIDECNSIMKNYSDSDIIEAQADSQKIISFVIPYYEIKFLLALSENEHSSKNAISNEAIKDFVILCKQNNCEKEGLETLLAIEDRISPDNGEVHKNLSGHINALSRDIIKNESNKYSHIVNSQVNDSKLSMAMSESITKKTNSRIALTITSFIITCLIILLFVIIILNSKLDGLTLLHNRRTFNNDVDRIKHFRLQYAVIMLDIDNFKHINDTYGHPEGDKVLQKMGQLINSVSKNNTDIRGYRYGGEEFTIITTKNSFPRTMEIAETLRHNMAATTWPFDPELTITISVGVAFSNITEDVVKKADENLYASKQRGKNKVTVD